MLREPPHTTRGIVEVTGEDRHVVMQHLRVLREADLVIAEVVAALVGLRDAVERKEEGRRERA